MPIALVKRRAWPASQAFMALLTVGAQGMPFSVISAITSERSYSGHEIPTLNTAAGRCCPVSKVSSGLEEPLGLKAKWLG